jgi:hypothetical protein
MTLVAKTRQLLMVNSACELKSVKELIAEAKVELGKLNHGAGMLTTNLTGFLSPRRC